MDTSVTAFLTDLPGAAGSWNGNQQFEITYTALVESTTYYVDLTGQGHQDISSNALTGDMYKDFTTGDFTGPTITSTTPVDGATGITLAAGTYIIQFNEPMDISVTTFLTNLPGAVGSWNGNQQFEITYTALAESTTYYVDLASMGHQDIASNALGGDLYKNFTTGDFTGPTITSTTPVDSATGIILAAGTYIIQFNEPMDTSVTAFLTNLPGAVGSWNGNQQFEITYTALAESTTYYVDLTGQGHQDISSNALTGDTYKDFITASEIAYITITDLTGNPINDMSWLTTDNNTEQFVCMGYNSLGVYVKDIDVTWALTGNLGIFNTAVGTSVTFDCTVPGTGMILAYNNTLGLVDITGTLTVELGVLHLTPLNPAITADEQIQFMLQDADGNMAYRNGTQPTALAIWNSINGTISDGLFDPWANGTWDISAYLGGVWYNTTILVTPGELAMLVIDPSFVEADAGQVVLFTTNGGDGKGNIVASPVGSTIWYLDGILQTSSSISSTEVGNHTIIAVQGGMLALAYLEVAAAPGSAIVIDQTGMIISADDTQTFTVSITDAFGNPVSATPVITWVAENGR
jgi:hypothetical protein